jgi:hypothetical protein
MSDIVRVNPRRLMNAKMALWVLRNETEYTDIQRVWQAMLDRAAAGDTTAAKLVFDRLMGSPPPALVMESLENIEQNLGIGDDTVNDPAQLQDGQWSSSETSLPPSDLNG